MLKGMMLFFIQRDQPLLFMLGGNWGMGEMPPDVFVLPQLTSCSFRIQTLC